MVPLTQLAHLLVAAVLQPGDVVIDATAGNGHDTVFLARLVGPAGTVYAVDIQQEALANTRCRLQEHQLDNVQLVEADHARLHKVIPVEHHGRIAAVMMNLGYLPGSDHCITTNADSTIETLNQMEQLLQPGGLLTIIAYPGHSGGKEETQAVESWLDQTSPQHWQRMIRPQEPITTAPRLYALCKRENNSLYGV